MTANELRLSLSDISATLVSGMFRHGPSVVTKPAQGNFTAPAAWATSGIALLTIALLITEKSLKSR